jgi:hypothetical protein
MKVKARIRKRLRAVASLGVEKVSPATIETDFEADKTQIDAGETVQFTDKSSLSPAYHAYDLGDGNFSNKASPSHTYAVAGDYTAIKHAGSTGSAPADAGNVHTQGITVEGIVDQIERDYSQTPKEAWSFRRVVRTYTGPCIRLRRASDDAEKDIGFGPSGILDTEEADAFIGNSKGYIKRWYGQRNGIDLVSRDNTSATQGLLALSGPNLLPQMVSENSESIAYDTSSSLSQGPSLDAHAILEVPSKSWSRNVFLRGGAGYKNRSLMDVWTNSFDLRINDDNQRAYIPDQHWGDLDYTRAYMSQTEMGLRWGGSIATNTTSNSGTFDEFGFGDLSQSGFHSYMNYQELLLYPEILSDAARDDIWNDAKRFFNV